MKITPLRNLILVRDLNEDEAITKTESGIIIPDSAKTKEVRRDAIVIKVGPDVENKDIKKDSHVLMTSMMMKEEFKQGDKVHGYLARETDILAIIED